MVIDTATVLTGTSSMLRKVAPRAFCFPLSQYYPIYSNSPNITPIYTQYIPYSNNSHHNTNICFRWTPHPVIETIGDYRDYTRVLLYSYYTTITGWGVLLYYNLENAEALASRGCCSEGEGIRLKDRCPAKLARTIFILFCIIPI